MTESTSNMNSDLFGHNDGIAVRARFDIDVVPEGRVCRRGLLVEITAPETSTPGSEEDRGRPDLNLALVIDRSGSMGRGRLQAAASAAQGIVAELGARDRLSLVSFDDEVTNHFEALAMDAAGRERARQEIRALRPGGTTNLAGGWHAGARCAAVAIEEGTHRRGHVLVLSDGHANRGMTDPERLARHAGELAHRQVKTSALGIGDGYSPLQLDALAEAGEGRLHDAETAEDIVDIVMGELGELREVAAESLSLTLRYSEELRADLLTRGRTEQSQDTIEIAMGDLRAGRMRRAAMKFEVPEFSAGQCFEFSGDLRWKDASTGEFHDQRVAIPDLSVVGSGEAASQQRNPEVVRVIADLWEASLAYEAASLNEAGNRHGAELLIAQASDDHLVWVRGLADAGLRTRRVARTRATASRSWPGRSKRHTISLAKKLLRDEQDHRLRETGRWDDHLKS